MSSERAAVAREVLTELGQSLCDVDEHFAARFVQEFRDERFPAPPAPETVTVGKSEWRLSPNGYWTGSAGEIVSYATWAHEFLHRIASDARELAKRDARIAELKRDATEVNGRLTAARSKAEQAQRNEEAMRRHLNAANAAVDAARREVEALQERLVAVAPSPALSAEEKQGSHPAPVAPAPIPLGATVEVEGDVAAPYTRCMVNGNLCWESHDGGHYFDADGMRAVLITAIYRARHPVATRETVERVAEALRRHIGIGPNHAERGARAALRAAGFTVEGA